MNKHKQKKQILGRSLKQPKLILGIGLFIFGITMTALVFSAKASATAVSRTLPTGRIYNVYKPTNLVGPAPIVIVMHGMNLTAEWAEKITDFNTLADKNHFIVVYGKGTNASWNAGSCCKKNTSDDSAYLDQIVADVNTIYPINMKRQYLVGFSNGGMMAYRAACIEPGRWAAIGVMSGTSVTPCSPHQPFSVIHIHGLKDSTVPYNGGYSEYLKMNVTSSNLLQGYLNKQFGCSAKMTTKKVGQISRRYSEGCPTGVALQTVTLDSLAHSWSTPTNGLDASAAIWDFLWKHPKNY